MDLLELIEHHLAVSDHMEPLIRDDVTVMEESERAFARRVIQETIDQGFHKELRA